MTGVYGCSKPDGSTGTLPAASVLLSEAAAAMGEVDSAHVSLVAEGETADLPVRRADGDLKRDGDAKGTIQLDQSGVLIEYEFVVLGEVVYLKGVTGGWQEVPAALAATIYDPSAILDPERGVAKVLATASGATTEAVETIDGRRTYRVAVALDSTATAALVPGVGAGVTGKLWLDEATRRLRRAVVSIPAGESGRTGTVTIDLTDIDKPVTISAP